MFAFHDAEYIKFLKKINPSNIREFPNEMQKCKFLFPTQSFFIV